MGVIIKFPVIVTDQKATEYQFGITPQLCGGVSLTGSTSAVVSEHGLSVVMDELSANISGQNVGVGLSVFDSISTVMPSEMLVLQFNSISGYGDLYAISNDSTVFVNTRQAGTPGSSGDFVVTKKTLNGGINQVGANIIYNMTSPIQLMQVQEEWVIGKILLRCTEEFDSTDMCICIGFEANPSAFVLPFSAPGSITTDTLVKFNYGNLMNDKVEYIESSTSAILSNSGTIQDGQWINAYFRGADRGTKGKLQCVIFYDNADVETI